LLSILAFITIPLAISLPYYSFTSRETVVTYDHNAELMLFLLSVALLLCCGFTAVRWFTMGKKTAHASTAVSDEDNSSVLGCSFSLKFGVMEELLLYGEQQRLMSLQKTIYSFQDDDNGRLPKNAE
jgi:hypothetical protein